MSPTDPPTADTPAAVPDQLLLAALLDTLLPGDSDFPAAGAHGLAAVVAADLAAGAEGRAALAALLAALPAGFATQEQAAREAALAAIEAADPRRFERVLAAAYLAYYTDPGVRAAIERTSGYAARPPQPEGYTLPPFDESLLARQKARPSFWRRA